MANGFDGTFPLPEPPVPNGFHTASQYEPTLFHPGQQPVQDSRPGQSFIGNGGTFQFESRPNGSLASSASGAPPNTNLEVNGSNAWSITDRIAAQVQALLAHASQTGPQTNGVNSTSRFGASPSANLPTSRPTEFPDVQFTIPSSMPLTNGSHTLPQSVQAPGQLPPELNTSISPASQQDTAQLAAGQWVLGQASAGSPGMSSPGPASSVQSPSHQFPSGLSSSTSSGSWAPDLQLAIESSERLQAAIGLVDVATHTTPSGPSASVPADNYYHNDHHNNIVAANNHTGNHTTSASSQHGWSAQQNGHHTATGQDDQLNGNGGTA